MNEKIGRNDPCPCGSGKKYKQCCINKPKAPKFKAKLLSQPKEVDMLSRTFGAHIETATTYFPPEKEQSEEKHEKA